jgi:hypothetical protein
MLEWSKNNRACTTTWTTLRVLDQNGRTFDKSGPVKMEQLTFWNKAASAQMRKLQAQTLSTQIDNVFRLIRGAKYESGVTRAQAIAGMVATMTDAEKTIADLAEVNDASYQFWGEKDGL